MADDIDIEEHDLMENPRLKSIFPDLSIIKREILDPEAGKIQLHLPKNEDDYCSKLIIKSSFVIPKEEPIFNDTDIKFQVSINVNSNKNDVLQSKSNFCSKIILGTKPPRHNDIDEKLLLQVRVNLKNINNFLAKSKRYCDICLILFSTQQIYKDHVCIDFKKTSLYKKKEKIHLEDYSSSLTEQIISKNEQCKGTQIKCFHCNASFLTQKSLVDHLYNVLDSKTQPKMSQKSENSSLINVPSILDISNNNSENVYNNYCKDEKCFYQCHICSHYFNELKFYEVHLRTKHRLKEKLIDITKIQFHPKCRFCDKEFLNMEDFNIHLQQKHKNILTKNKPNTSNKSRLTNKTSSSNLENERDMLTVTLTSVLHNYDSNMFVLRSIIFKCLQCHIHFLSSDVTVNHKEHNQIQTNWKCRICLKNFKCIDEKKHTIQHLHFTSMMVYELDEIDNGKVLVKCSECNIYFNEENFLNHSSVCGKDVSVYCNLCDIFINNKIENSHLYNHETKQMLASDFILIDLCKQITPGLNLYQNNVKAKKRKQQPIKTDHPLKHVKTNLDYCSNRDSNFEPLSKQTMSKVDKIVPNEIGTDSELHATRSVSNKSDLADSDSRSGLVLLEALIQPKQIIKNKKTKICNKNKKLNQISCMKTLQFQALHLTYCRYCECFISVRYKRDAHVKSLCKDFMKHVCKYCGIIVTAKASDNHKALHISNPDIKLQDFTFYNIKNNKIIRPPMPIFPKCHTCRVHFTSKTIIKKHICSEENFLQCRICDIKLSEMAFELHMPFHLYSLNSYSTAKSLKKFYKYTDNGTQTNDLKHEESIDYSDNIAVAESQPPNINRYSSVIFCCKNCDLSVTTYDNLIIHCHSHFLRCVKAVETKRCDICNLTFKIDCFEYHRKLHSQGISKETFKIIYIDVLYFGCSNEEWNKYVFNTLSKEEQEKILEESIYRCERRIKMEITQAASLQPELTIYKCEKCRCYIGNIMLIHEHTQNCRSKASINPCTFCGIPLVSAKTRIEHEKKFHTSPGVTLKSYRIVSFNLKEHKILNDAIANTKNCYVLYKCRNCSAVAGKMKWNHQCYAAKVLKCAKCGLLFYDTDYQHHIPRHKDIKSFQESNIKVIMFGEKSKIIHNDKNLECSFSGIVYDYTFYKCIKCEVCVRYLRQSSKHLCLIDAAKLKCSKCNLYFDEGKLKGHLKLHDSDPDFIRENMLIVDFD